MSFTKENIRIYFFIIALLFPFCSVAKQYNFGHIDYRNGLSHNHVLSFAEDNNGFLWIGTTSGLNRYDGYSVKVFEHVKDDSASLLENYIHDITKDQLGRLWLQLSNGVSVLNPNTEDFINLTSINVNGQTIQLSGLNKIEAYGDSLLLFSISGLGIICQNIFTNVNTLIQPDSLKAFSISSPLMSTMRVKGDLLYVVHQNGMIDILNIANHKVVKKIDTIYKKILGGEYYFDLYIDNQDNIWMFGDGDALGVYMLSTNGELTHLNIGSDPALNSNIITCIIQDDENNIWIGTDHGGLNIYNPHTGKVTFVLHDSNNENSLSQNVITSMYKSNGGNIWIGTFKQGVNYYNKDLFRFFHYYHKPNDESSLSYNDVNCFVEDKQGNIWIGTNGKGLIYFDRKKNTFIPFSLNQGTPGGLQSSVIVSLYYDKKGRLWISTYHGGLSVYDGNRLITYMHNPDNIKSIKDNKVWEVFEDSHGNFWVGMLNGGLDLFESDKEIFYHYTGMGLHKINSSFIMDIKEDGQGNVWFGTDNGLFILNYESSRFIHYSHQNNDPNSLSNNFVYNVFRDSYDNFWIGTRNGLNLFDEEKNDFIHFDKNSGLTDNTIMSIIESKPGELWISTSNGLSRVMVKYNNQGRYMSHVVVNFNEADGLQGREFNEGSALKTRNGELIFGGYNGFNLFVPEKEGKTAEKLYPHIVGLEIFGEDVQINPGNGKHKLINSSVLEEQTVKLNYQENMFSLKFVTINFLSAKKLNYRYKLEGFNEQWIYTNWQDRKATFTNLNPGKYTFRVQSSDFLSNWDDTEVSMTIVVLPPWYRKWYSYVAYYLIVLGLIILFRRMLILKERARFQKEQAEKESERQLELNLLKTRFFTNVSHEFRTPLTLILTPLERLMKTTSDADTLKHLSLIHQNAKRLLNLVNQLLDFRKAEANKLQANFIFGNIIGFIEYTIHSFSDFRESKQIDLEFLPDEKELFMQFDRDKLEKIIFNLLSNAFKFTPANGHIRVFTELIESSENEKLRIIVEDSGIGISPENIEKIFDRFFQTELPNKFITRGSGIGLSLTKDFVELHHGRIWAESESGKGSRFFVELPVNRSHTAEVLDEDSLMGNKENVVKAEMIDYAAASNQKTVLLVDDNADFRFYLKESLSNAYHIMEAENGRKALKLLESTQPHLIVSDVMMPEMDGLELCEEIKTNSKFSHIPIILLTAKSTQQDKLDGLNQGADEYITKPFSLEILESRIEYLLTQRERFIKMYQQDFKVEPDTDGVTSLDKKLLKKTLDLINKNISNSEFSVNKMSRELGMSRVHLYKKISSLTGKTPIELIRLVRLKKAAELLVNSELSVSEITYEVGFTDPRYFSKQFKAEFNILPSKYKETKGLGE